MRSYPANKNTKCEKFASSLCRPIVYLPTSELLKNLHRSWKVIESHQCFLD